jgi:hypothetical protein
MISPSLFLTIEVDGRSFVGRAELCVPWNNDAPLATILIPGPGVYVCELKSDAADNTIQNTSRLRFYNFSDVPGTVTVHFQRGSAKFTICDREIVPVYFTYIPGGKSDDANQ